MLLVSNLSRQATIPDPLVIRLQGFLIAVPKLKERKLSLLYGSDIFPLKAFGKYLEAAETLLNKPQAGTTLQGT